MSNQERIVTGGTVVVSRAALRELAQRYHIRRLVLFGSAVRGELKPDRDIDLLAEFENDESPSLGGMVDLQEAFAALFGGRKVDVATPSILNNPIANARSKRTWRNSMQPDERDPAYLL